MLAPVLQHPVEALLCLPFLLLGLSHMTRPGMWRSFFVELHAMGPRGVIWRSFTLELWPAVAIVAFHQEWTWPGILLTIHGHALLAKIAIALLAPELGLRSLAMAQTHGNRGFVIGGAYLMAMGFYCLLRLVL